MATVKRVEVVTRRGRVAIVRTRERHNSARYRVSYKYGAEHWCEHCNGLTAAPAFSAFRDLVRWQNRITVYTLRSVS